MTRWRAQAQQAGEKALKPVVVSAATFGRRCREGHPLFAPIAKEGLRL